METQGKTRCPRSGSRLRKGLLSLTGNDITGIIAKSMRIRCRNCRNKQHLGRVDQTATIDGAGALQSRTRFLFQPHLVDTTADLSNEEQAGEDDFGF